MPKVIKAYHSLKWATGTLLLPPLSEIIRGQQWKPSIYSSGVHVGQGGFKGNFPGSTYPGFLWKYQLFTGCGWYGYSLWVETLLKQGSPSENCNWHAIISTYSLFSSWLLLLQEFHDIPMARPPSKTFINNNKRPRRFKSKRPILLIRKLSQIYFTTLW